MCAALLMGTIGFFTSEEVQQSVKYLGFPKYFSIELESAKVLGIIALLLPMTPGNVKEWAYAAFGIMFISAFVAHTSVGDPIGKAIIPLVFLGLLVISYIFKAKEKLN